MKKGSSHKTGTQQVEQFDDLGKRYSEINAKLSGVEQAPQKMIQELHSMKKSGDITLGKSRNVTVHGIPEPFMKEGKQQERAVRCPTVNLHGTMKISRHVAIKRVLRQEDGRRLLIGDAGICCQY